MNEELVRFFICAGIFICGMIFDRIVLHCLPDGEVRITEDGEKDLFLFVFKRDPEAMKEYRTVTFKVKKDKEVRNKIPAYSEESKERS